MKSKQEKIQQVENGLLPEYFIKGDKLKSITEAMKETNTAGISVAIIHNFEMVWAKGYGITDIETRLPVNTNTIFQAASISKPLTALAVMKLVQDGRLDLDENINAYLKTWKLPENEFTSKNKVTLRNLLSHTAGVTGHGFPGYNVDAEMPTLVQVLNGEFPANTDKIVVDMEPNTQCRYSGGGYTIVQLALIDQLQKPFQEIMRELVLDPLGMMNSFYSNSALDEKQCINATAGHNMDGEQVLGKRHVYPEMAAAGLWTTAEDLAKFSIEVQKSLKGESNKILTKEFMEIMTTPVLNGGYNIGLGNEKINTEQLVGHNGGNEGYACSMLFHKEKGFGMVFMSNSDRGYEMKMPFFRSVATAYGFDNVLHPDYEIVDLSTDEIKLFSGNYKMEFDKTLKIFQDNSKLVYKTIYDEPKQLDYVGNNIMIDIDRTVKIEYREESGKMYMNGNEIQRLNDGEKLASDYIEEDNIEQAVRCYQEFMQNDNDIKLRLEDNLNDVGYNLIWNKNYNTAIAFLKINTILFPQSANSWDSLGEVYFFDKQYDLAIKAMKKSLEYAPNNLNAVEFIKKAEECLKTKAYYSFKTSGGYNTNTEFWADLDFSGKTPKVNEIVKLPAEITSLLGAEFVSKPYLNLNYDKVMANLPKDVKVPKLDMKDLGQSQKKFTEMLSKYGQDILNNPNIFSDLGDQTTNSSVALHKYKLSFDDKTLKESINYIVKKMVSSEDGINMLKSFISEDMNGKTIKEQLDVLNKTMDNLNKTTILGKRGLVLNYYVNKEGYLTQLDGYVDFEINTAELDEMPNKQKGKKIAPIISLSLDFDTKYTNINGDIKIQLPVANAKNSIDLANFIKQSLPQEPTAPKKVPTKKAPAKKAPVKKVPAKKTPAKKAPVKKVVVKKAPVKVK